MTVKNLIRKLQAREENSEVEVYGNIMHDGKGYLQIDGVIITIE